MKCIRCECLLPPDFAPLDEAGAYSLCETCFTAYMQANRAARGRAGEPGMSSAIDHYF